MRKYWILFTFFAVYGLTAHAAPTLDVQRGSGSVRVQFPGEDSNGMKAAQKGNQLQLQFAHKTGLDAHTLVQKLPQEISAAAWSDDGRTLTLTFAKPLQARTFLTDDGAGVELVDTPAALTPSAGSAKPAEDTVLPNPIVPPTATDAEGIARLGARAITHSAGKRGVLSAEPAPLGDGVMLDFDFGKRSAAAVFRRNGYAWIAFNQATKLDLTALQNAPDVVTGPPELLEQEKYTLLRIPLLPGAGAEVTKIEGTDAWRVTLTTHPKTAPRPVEVQLRTDPPLKPHIMLPMLEVSQPFTITDPDIGDELIILPSFKPGDSVVPARKFVDFELMESSQGLVVRRISDEAGISVIRGGVRVTTRRGASISPDLPGTNLEKGSEAAAQTSSNTLFPYAQWKPQVADHFDAEARAIMRTIGTETAEPINKNQLRLRLVQLYLSQGMAPEALGMLELIRSSDMGFFVSNKLSALNGAANFLQYRFAEAAQDFNAIELNDVKEVAFWRAMLGELLGSNDQHGDYLAYEKDFISQYPPAFRQRVAIVAADRSVAARDYRQALQILNTIQDPEVIDPIRAYANFVLGSISAGTNQPKAAIEVWMNLANNYDNPYVRANAEFALITTQLRRNELKKEDAIHRLEGLRLSWRGDALELNLLALLGGLYAEKQDYINALRIWRDIVMIFPGTTYAADATSKMSTAFGILFSPNAKGGSRDSLELVQALSLYYEFRELTPPGTVGDQMIEQVANRLLEADLLAQAAALLENHMVSKLEQEDRSRMGAMLAKVYLRKKDPKSALQALAQSAYGDNPPALRTERDQLAAQALVESDRSEEALRVLEGDESATGAYWRAAAYWRKKDWPNLIASGEHILKQRKDPGAALTAQEEELLVWLALAYGFEKDEVQKAYLRDYFGALMEKSPLNSVFQFVTRADIIPSPDTFDQVVQAIDQTHKFLTEYKAKPAITETTPAKGT